jgi:hypothetical protein
MRSLTYIMLMGELAGKAFEHGPDTSLFLSVTSPEVFKHIASKIGKGYLGALPGASHTANASHLLRHAYDRDARFVKIVGERMMQPFVKKDRSMVVLKDRSFAIDLNAVRKKAVAMYGERSKAATVSMLLFDENYTDTGLLHDLRRLTGADVDISADHLKMPRMDEDIYLARWGGPLGRETYERPYDMEP